MADALKNVNVPLLLKIRAAINEKPDQFDMNSWFNSENYSQFGMHNPDFFEGVAAGDEDKCGTSFCFGGWCLLLNGDRQSKEILATEHGDAIIDRALELLRIHVEDSSYLSWWTGLFYEARWPYLGPDLEPVERMTKIIDLLIAGINPWDWQR